MAATPIACGTARASASGSIDLKTKQGSKTFADFAALRMSADDPDYSARDLLTAIKVGDFPKWTMFIQVMPEADAKTYDGNPFDLTKVWPHGEFPLIEVGEMTLNRNPQNCFAEVEQAAFEPSNIVPGIGFSPDKVLQNCVLSYADAHRYRIGVRYDASAWIMSWCWEIGSRTPIRSPGGAPGELLSRP